MKADNPLRKYAMIRALETVLTKPNRKFSIIGLANEAKMAPSAAKYAMDYMLANDMVTREIIGRTHQYQANLSNCVVRQWKILFSVQAIKESNFIAGVLKNVRNISCILLYGSTALGLDDEKSDFDIIIVSDSLDINHVFKYVTIAGRELNIQVYTPAEWRKKASKDKAFYESVIIDSIQLYGDKPVVI